MSFNNPANKISLTGFVTDEFKDINSYSIEFTLGVHRKVSKGEKAYVDYFTLYVNSAEIVMFCKTQIKKGMTIQVKGELRNWFDKSYRICVDEVILKGRF